MAYEMTGLPALLAQLVHFAWEDYYGCIDNIPPESSIWTVAYQCACMLAQYTHGGENGVDTESAYKGLRVYEEMSYDDRLTLANKLVEEFDGSKIIITQK